MGVDSFGPFGSDQVQATRRSLILVLLIFLRGLNPNASYVRRHASQSPSGTLASMASVTGRNASRGLTLGGAGGTLTCGANPPPPGRGQSGGAIAFSAAGSSGNSRVPGREPFSWSTNASNCP